VLSCGAASTHAIAAFCWRITRHNTLAALADLYPQWLIRDLLPLPPSGGIPREATRSLSPPSSASLRAKAAGRSLRRSKIATRPRWSRAWIQQQEITMAQIGTFTRAEDGSYSGTIKTLSLNIKARFLPAEPSENEKAPSLRVMAGNVEIGAAWQRTSKENTVYHSVKLDDPSFSAPIYANLVAVDDGYALVWSR
jgi:uncharacterized protein (DUF736 family)